MSGEKAGWKIKFMYKYIQIMHKNIGMMYTKIVTVVVSHVSPPKETVFLKM